MLSGIFAIHRQNNVVAADAGVPGWLALERFYDTHAAAFRLSHARAELVERKPERNASEPQPIAMECD